MNKDIKQQILLGLKTVELHVIQTSPPNMMNRGKNGEPKTISMGGSVRQTISGVSQKREIRVLEETVRTRVPHELILRVVGEERWRPLAMALMAARYGEYDKDGTLKVTVLLDPEEVQNYVSLLVENEERLEAARAEHAHQLIVGSDKEAEKAAAAFKAELQDVLKGYKAHVSEINSLMGRFSATLKDEVITAAASYSFGVSTHRYQPMSNYFVAVDDLTGIGGHLGNQTMSASTLYRFATLDIEQHRRNMAREGVEVDVISLLPRWAKAFAYGLPMGGSHSAFARTLPEYMLIVLRDVGHPVTLANAFANASYPHDGITLLEDSVTKLKRHLAYNIAAFESAPVLAAFELGSDVFGSEGLDLTRIHSLKELTE